MALESQVVALERKSTDIAEEQLETYEGSGHLINKKGPTEEFSKSLHFTIIFFRFKMKKKSYGMCQDFLTFM